MHPSIGLVEAGFHLGRERVGGWVQKRTKEGSNLKACPLPKRLEAEMASAEDSTKIKTQGKRQPATEGAHFSGLLKRSTVTRATRKGEARLTNQHTRAGLCLTGENVLIGDSSGTIFKRGSLHKRFCGGSHVFQPHGVSTGSVFSVFPNKIAGRQVHWRISCACDTRCLSATSGPDSVCYVHYLAVVAS